MYLLGPYLVQFFSVGRVYAFAIGAILWALHRNQCKAKATARNALWMSPIRRPISPFSISVLTDGMTGG